MVSIVLCLFKNLVIDREAKAALRATIVVLWQTFSLKKTLYIQVYGCWRKQNGISLKIFETY